MEEEKNYPSNIVKIGLNEMLSIVRRLIVLMHLSIECVITESSNVNTEENIMIMFLITNALQKWRLDLQDLKSTGLV